MREANQIGALQPTTLVAYEADVADVFDCRNDAALEAQGMDAAALADATWRDRMRTNGEAQTQAFARRLIGAGCNGLLVRSFAAGSGGEDLNIVLWRWGISTARLILIDDENRLLR